MSAYHKMLENLKDEVLIKITDTKQSIEGSTVETVLIANFDDGTKGFYILDLKHDVRIWVRWKRAEK